MFLNDDVWSPKNKKKDINEWRKRCNGYFYPLLLLGWNNFILIRDHTFFFFFFFLLSHSLTSSSSQSKTLILFQITIMDGDSSWSSRLSSASRRYQAALQSRSGSFFFSPPRFLSLLLNSIFNFFLPLDIDSSSVRVIFDCKCFDFIYIPKINLKLNSSREKIVT